MVELLYGVNHGGRGRDLSNNFCVDVVVEPASKMINYLHALPSGTKVGIEYHPNIYHPPQDALARPDKNTKRYWENILGIVIEGGLEPVFIDNPDMYQRYAEKLLQAESKANFSTIIDDETARSIEEDQYRAEVEARHILWIEREIAMVDAIAQTQPDVVIMGRGHTEYLMANKDSQLLPKGIIVGDYKADKPIEITIPSSIIDRTDVYHRIAETEVVNIPNPDLFPDREMLRRQHNAVIYGRINPDSNPQFVGTWDIWCRQRGLFEMYVRGEGVFAGRIEDVYGTGKSFHLSRGNEFNFTK